MNSFLICTNSLIVGGNNSYILLFLDMGALISSVLRNDFISEKGCLINALLCLVAVDRSER